MAIQVTIPQERLSGLYWAVDAANNKTKDQNLWWRIKGQNGLSYVHGVLKTALYDGLSVTMNFEDYQEMKLLIEEYK